MTRCVSADDVIGRIAAAIWSKRHGTDFEVATDADRSAAWGEARAAIAALRPPEPCFDEDVAWRVAAKGGIDAVGAIETVEGWVDVVLAEGRQVRDGPNGFCQSLKGERPEPS